MTQQTAIKLFEDKNVRVLWDEQKEQYFFSIVDVVAILTQSPNPRKYWSVLKTRLKAEGSQMATNCSQLKMLASDGKIYLTDVAKGLEESKKVARAGGSVAEKARKELEDKTGKPVITRKNAKDLKTIAEE